MAVVSGWMSKADRKAVREGRLALSGKRRGLRAVLPFLGPALVAAVAYVDPGNYATNIEAGSLYGFRLLWVVLLANLMAMVIQNLSAKLGLASGHNLPELCRMHLPKAVSVGLWIISELAAMATDVAEFLGASLALQWLFGIPLWVGAVITGVATYAMLSLERLGFRPFERLIGLFIGVIAVCYLVEAVWSPGRWREALPHLVVPWLGDSGSLTLAVGIIGATVMPHAVYLHSGLTQQRIVPRSSEELRKIQRFQRMDVILGMSVAGLVNLAMMYMAGAAFHAQGSGTVTDLATAYRTLEPLLGPAAAWVFLVSLLASGLSSSAVGTLAGQVIMQGFVGFRIPVSVRRIITMLPTIVVLALGVDPVQALVWSQVVLSLALPAPLIALVSFTRRRDIMGDLANPPWLTSLAATITVLVIGLNILLLLSVFGITAW